MTTDPPATPPAVMHCPACCPVGRSESEAWQRGYDQGRRNTYIIDRDRGRDRGGAIVTLLWLAVLLYALWRFASEDTTAPQPAKRSST